LLFLGFIGPAVVYAAFVRFSSISQTLSYRNFFVGLIESILTTSVATDYLKNVVGRHRPDFLARCVVAANACVAGTPCPVSSCTGVTSDITDGLRSFPSGHSSLTFSGAFFLTAALWQVYQPLQRGNHHHFFICALPVAGAVYVAISRTQDNHHHWQDITIGSLLGILFSLLALAGALSRQHRDEKMLPMVNDPSNP